MQNTDRMLGDVTITEDMKTSLHQAPPTFWVDYTPLKHVFTCTVHVMASSHFKDPIFKTNMFVKLIRLRNNQLVQKMRKAKTHNMDGTSGR